MKVENYVKINGEYVNWESLSKKRQEEIGEALNTRALKNIGYKPQKPSIKIAQ